jgi:hypothetical protein
MKNIQIIDGAENCTFSIFQATEEEFQVIFPKADQDIEFSEDLFGRLMKTAVYWMHFGNVQLPNMMQTEFTARFFINSNASATCSPQPSANEIGTVPPSILRSVGYLDTLADHCDDVPSQPHHILNTPNLVSGTGALHAAKTPKPPHHYFLHAAASHFASIVFSAVSLWPAKMTTDLIVPP